MNEQPTTVHHLPEDSNKVALFYANFFDTPPLTEPLQNLLMSLSDISTIEALMLYVRREPMCQPMLSMDIVTDLSDIGRADRTVSTLSAVRNAHEDFLRVLYQETTFPPYNLGYFNTRGARFRDQLPELMPNMREKLAHIEVFGRVTATGPVDNITVALTPEHSNS